VRDLDNLPMLGDNLNAASEFYTSRGDYAPALRAAEEAQRLSTAIGNRWGQAYNAMGRGTILHEQGRYRDAIVCLVESVDLAEQIGFVQPQVFARTILAILYHELGAPARAGQELEKASAVARQKLPGVLPVLQAVLAQEQLAVGAVAAAGETARRDRAATALDGRSMLQ
jgi:tetratricopeptide (TPR) repeat protein